MLDALSRAFLLAVDRLTREGYGETEGNQVRAELQRMGHEPGATTLYNLMRRLRDEGYLDATIAGGMDFDRSGLVSLTPLGRELVQEIDPFERVHAEARRVLASPAFANAFPEAFDAWAAAERLLWEEDADRHLTAIGHHAREAMQAFASAMVNAHRPDGVEKDASKVEKRLGAVIAIHRDRLGDARRGALEALGVLWTKTNRLVQRQEHGGQKEGEAVTWSDARRIVYLTMFCMVEFAETLEDLEAPLAR